MFECCNRISPPHKIDRLTNYITNNLITILSKQSSKVNWASHDDVVVDDS